MNRHVTNMTIGSPRAHILRHALPLLLGNLLQLSYNALDSAIAGKLLGQDALAAEGNAGSVMNLVILGITGLCIGAGVLMSEAFGAGDHRRLRQVLSNTLLTGFALGCALALVGVLLSGRILQLLQVPEALLPAATDYLRIIFLGVPFTFCYNALAAALKSVGDSRTPLKFLAISAIGNALLDLLFLGVFRFGIRCSALTTVIAEVFCALMAMQYVHRRVPELAPGPAERRFDPAIQRQLLHYGAPTALQQAIQPICKVLIQGQINLLGVSAIAAFHAVTRVDDFACIPAQSISSAISTFLAQNRGADRSERIRPGFGAGVQLALCWWLVIGPVTLLLRGPLVALFVEGEGSKTVIQLGSQYLLLMSAFYLLPAMTNSVQGYFRGMGQLRTTLLATLLQASVRTIAVYILAPRLGIVGVAWACAIGWSLMLLVEVPWYFLHSCSKIADSP